MADDMNKTAQTNPADAGQDVQTQQTAENDTQQPKTFTQDELNRIINERLAREREKYKDYAELKKTAEEFQKIRESQMTEQEKLQARLAEYERMMADKELELASLKAESIKNKVLSEMGLPLQLIDKNKKPRSLYFKELMGFFILFYCKSQVIY